MKRQLLIILFVFLAIGGVIAMMFSINLPPKVVTNRSDTLSVTVDLIKTNGNWQPLESKDKNDDRILLLYNPNGKTDQQIAVSIARGSLLSATPDLKTELAAVKQKTITETAKTGTILADDKTVTQVTINKMNGFKSSFTAKLPMTNDSKQQATVTFTVMVVPGKSHVLEVVTQVDQKYAAGIDTSNTKFWTVLNTLTEK